VEGRPLVLGGVQIESKRGLLGHSDADVLLHAVCDALLGAAALGDIGIHFPDTDERFKGISSLLLLEHVCKLVRDHRYVIGNIDVTILLQAPKIAPYVREMSLRIADAADLAVGCVSIKATTNEGLGAIGREEGCAAMAVTLLVAKPLAKRTKAKRAKGMKS
jgi:2-C-methyl-D-erythritol 2,4-cyclodiphosphate synthase